MSVEKIDTLIIGGGQAGIALSEHLGAQGVPHVVLERGRIAERWRSERWDSLVANGPAWHDRFPNREFTETGPDGFTPAHEIVAYLVGYAQQVGAPIREGVEVTSLTRQGELFIAETSAGTFEAKHVVAATGPFQRAIIPPLVPDDAGIAQLHSAHYKNPAQLPPGAVMVIGAGSSGVQIADELRKSGRRVYLSVGPHDRPPRRYRGRDFVWWLGALGMWDAKTVAPDMAHVTIAVSGAEGGHTVDFRNLAAAGITLVGRTTSYEAGVLRFADDIEQNIRQGDENYLSMLRAADEYVAAHKLDLPPEPEAHELAPLPACVTNPLAALDIKAANVTSIIWATGYGLDFGWLKLDAFDAAGNPRHQRGVAEVPGLYFLGLAWLSRRASPFIWGVWHDAAYIAHHIAARRQALAAE
ncbi:NAD(P)/FAD-dependent oxidoreductase [Acidocella sp.]|uniref:flavin-containing monooxygenase n=1 Tax=Acidocella sp. TaxID=50710 RepID=UPI0026132953|nr:NAD(P)/FAD-dependent oxidoreductase [Acidocella sp.]